jgi:enoyl-CoA hydratase/carnithine racemase
MMDQMVLGEKKGNIFYITLNRPEKRNAISFEMLQQIAQMVEELIVDPEIRVIILKGEGKLFSAGVDFNSLGALVGRFMPDSAAGGAPIRADISRFQQILNRLETIEIPIICAMHSRAYGLSVEFSFVCDIRLMSDDCQWCMQELKFGLIPDLGGTARLSRIVGQSRAMEILMTGRMYTAQQALDWGIVNYIYPPDRLLAEAENMAHEIIKMAPLAVGAAKRVIKRGDGVDLMTHLDMEVGMQSMLLRTDDFKEGIQALMEKRDPQWKRK